MAESHIVIMEEVIGAIETLIVIQPNTGLQPAQQILGQLILVELVIRVITTVIQEEIPARFTTGQLAE